MTKITVKDVDITIVKDGDKDYICLTDIVRNIPDGLKLIEKWLSNKNTIEFLGVWERLNNPDFNSPEFGGIMLEAGTNRFTMSVKRWVTETNAIGIKARTGKAGGTYAHKDIAFEFGTWISPEFKLLLIKEFQRLKEEEQQRLESGWDVRRLISKANYSIQTDAIAQKLLPTLNVAKDKEWLVYAEEADLVNYAVFKMTAKQWRDANPELTAKKMNIRDTADVYQLIVLSNLESLNGELIRHGENKKVRYTTLAAVAQDQLKSLHKSTAAGVLNAQSPIKRELTNSSGQNTFNKSLKGVLRVPPPKRDE